MHTYHSCMTEKTNMLLINKKLLAVGKYYEEFENAGDVRHARMSQDLKKSHFEELHFHNIT